MAEAKPYDPKKVHGPKTKPNGRVPWLAQPKTAHQQARLYGRVECAMSKSSPLREDARPSHQLEIMRVPAT